MAFDSILQINNLILATTLFTIFVSFFLCFHVFKRDSLPEGSPGLITSGNYPLLGALSFFTKRHDLFQHERRFSKNGVFRFNVGREHIFGVTGSKGRTALFDNRNLNLGEGQIFLFGGTVRVKNEDGEALTGSAKFTSWMLKNMATLMKTEQLEKRTPAFISDLNARFQALQDSAASVVDPFESINEAIFQLTMRLFACEELANDWALQDRFIRRFQRVERNFSPADAIIPWLPTPSKVVRTIAGAQLYMDVKKIMDQRQATGIRHDDSLQMLIDQGEKADRVIAFVISALFAGLLNSGINAAYIIYALALDPYWMGKVRQELEEVANEFSTSGGNLLERLSSLAFDVWDTQFGTTYMVIQESIRRQLMGSAIRRNISNKPVNINDTVIPPGGFAVYNFTEPHNDPNIYPDPERFDPGRFEPGRAEDKKEPMAFVGWGAGRHPCAGVRFAKIEIKMTVALFLARFDYTACDIEGKPLENPKLPPSELNAPAAVRPKKPVYLKLSVR